MTHPVGGSPEKKLLADLAARLKQVTVDNTYWTNDWMAVAEECIRQMEWARRSCAAWEPDPERTEDPVLTIAPDDWKPPTDDWP